MFFRKTRSGLHRSRHNKSLIGLVPAGLVVLGLFAGGVVVAIGQSLGLWSATGGHSGLTLVHYAGLWRDREVWRSAGLTIGIGLMATLSSAAGGAGIALALRRRAARSGWISSLLQAPLAIPHLSMAIVLMNLVAPGGLVARLIFRFGWIGGPEGFPELINDGWGVGIFLAYLLKEVPFVALMLLALLLRVGEGYEEVARTLGAGWWQRLRHVWLPLMAPAGLTSALMVFAFILGAYEVPALLGRQYPAMLSVVVQRRYQDIDLAARPGAIALAVVLSLVTAGLVWLFLRVSRRHGGAERLVLF